MFSVCVFSLPAFIVPLRPSVISILIVSLPPPSLIFLFSSPLSPVLVPWDENHRDQTFTVLFKALSDSPVCQPCLAPELPLNNNTNQTPTTQHNTNITSRSVRQKEVCPFSLLLTFHHTTFISLKFLFGSSFLSVFWLCHGALWLAGSDSGFESPPDLNGDTLSHTDSCKTQTERRGWWPAIISLNLGWIYQLFPTQTSHARFIFI